MKSALLVQVSDWSLGLSHLSIEGLVMDGDAGRSCGFYYKMKIEKLFTPKTVEFQFGDTEFVFEKGKITRVGDSSDCFYLKKHWWFGLRLLDCFGNVIISSFRISESGTQNFSNVTFFLNKHPAGKFLLKDKGIFRATSEQICIRNESTISKQLVPYFLLYLLHSFGVSGSDGISMVD